MRLTPAVWEALYTLATDDDASLAAMSHMLSLALQRGDKVQADLWLAKLAERGYDLAPVMAKG